MDLSSKQLIEVVGLYCKDFRNNYLQLSLTDFANINNLNIKNVHAFEKGNANNIKYLFYYYNTSTRENKIIFATGLFNIL